MAQWKVVDHNGETVFDVNFVHSDPAVRGGLFTPREYAKRLAKENTDPEAPDALRAISTS